MDDKTLIYLAMQEEERQKKQPLPLKPMTEQELHETEPQRIAREYREAERKYKQSLKLGKILAVLFWIGTVVGFLDKSYGMMLLEFGLALFITIDLIKTIKKK